MISLQRKLKARTCKNMSDWLSLVLEAGFVPESLQEWEDEWSAQRQRVTEDIDSELRFATHSPLFVSPHLRVVSLRKFCLLGFFGCRKVQEQEEQKRENAIRSAHENAWHDAVSSCQEALEEAERRFVHVQWEWEGDAQAKERNVSNKGKKKNIYILGHDVSTNIARPLFLHLNRTTGFQNLRRSCSSRGRNWKRKNERQNKRYQHMSSGALCRVCGARISIVPASFVLTPLCQVDLRPPGSKQKIRLMRMRGANEKKSTKTN